MRRILIVALSVFAALIIAGLLALRTQRAREYARVRIVRALDARGMESQIGEVGYSVLGPSVTLYDVTIRSKAARELPPILKARRLSLNISVLGLLAGRYVLDEAVLDSPQVHWVVTEHGTSNLPKLAHDGGGRDTAVDNFRAGGGSLVYEDRRQNLVVRLPEWELSWDGDRNTMAADIELEARRAGSVELDRRKLAVDRLALAARVNRGGADVRSVKLATAGFQIDASGTAKGYANPNLNLKGHASLDLALLARFAGYTQPIAGVVRGPFSMTGSVDSLHIGGDLRGNQVSLEGFQKLALKFAVVYAGAARQLRLESVELEAPAANAHLTGTLSLGGGWQSAIQARVNQADLEALSALRRSRLLIASRASGNVSARFPELKIGQAWIRVELNLAGKRPEPARNVLPVSGPLLVVSQAGQVTASSDALRLLGAQAATRATVGPSGTLQGTVKGQVQHAEDLLGQLRAVLGRDEPLLPVNVSGALRFTAGLGGTISQPNVDLNLSAPALDVGRLENSRFTADALYNPERLLVERAELRWLGQTLAIEGTIGLGGSSPALDLNAKADGAAVAALIGGLAPGATAEAHIGGTLSHPRTTVGRVGLPGAIGQLLERK